MLDTKTLDDLATKLNDAIPPGAKAFQADLKNQFKQILQTVLGQLDIVTREEFDAQLKVLERTRQKIEALEKQVSEIQENRHTEK
ncbi:MAG: accessory factor UbiK family protein [Gammaproteobacteria bacterium]|nr:accessory factor UbiK family protein [Gammaproteobacteria bacterium]MDH5628749.1 accessory factor UbiK family protein [Gammaproteobacteria bacterium]